MMAAINHSYSLLEKLPKVRGRMEEDVELAKFTWFRVGGPAEVLFWPADEADLTEFLVKLPRNIPVTILGVSSNTLVRDGGIPGVSIRLGRGFHQITVDGETITAGAGTPNLKLSNAARDKAISGMEFLCGIPGALGGSIRMNAGAFEREIQDLVENVGALSRSGEQVMLSAEQMNFGYRQTHVSPDFIFVTAKLRGYFGRQSQIIESMTKIQTERRSSQPVNQPTGGSTFTNPTGATAWELIEKAGCRGLTRGGAQVSTKHCNFLINLGNATATDLEGLGEEVQQRVFDNSGIKLEWEIKRIGVHEKSGFGKIRL